VQILFILFFSIITSSSQLFAQDVDVTEEINVTVLSNLISSAEQIDKDINEKSKSILRVIDEQEKIKMKNELKELHKSRDEIQNKFDRMVTGIDGLVQKSQEKERTLSEDFELLLKPLIQKFRESTEEMRDKMKLKEEIKYYKIQLEQTLTAQKNIEALLSRKLDKEVEQKLEALSQHWNQQKTIIVSNLSANEHHLDILNKKNVPFSISLKNTLKAFLEVREYTVFKIFGIIIVMFILMKIFQIITQKLFPILTRPNRPFYIRLIDLSIRLFYTLVLFTMPIFVFYYDDDWVLLSIWLLVLIGMAWAFRNLTPKLWQQARLLLNIGSVREEERIFYHNLPWKVESINIFTVLTNPYSGMRLRIPVEALVGLTSRPLRDNEPWFPCKINDWIILKDGYYGKVVGVSLEFIELVDLGGGNKTYLVSEFLQQAPLNLSTDFRVIQTVGISYKHQKDSTTIIVQQLEEFITQQIEKEGYSHGLKKLIVQFSNANNSSLDFLIIGNFSGEMAPVYFRLKRAISRWFVDACNTYGWEIPFPQLSVHTTVNRPKKD